MTPVLTYIILAASALTIAMGVVCLTFGLLILFGGDLGGLWGCAIGAMCLFLGISRIRQINQEDMEG